MNISSMNTAQTAVTGALSEAMTTGNIKLVAAAAAGAALIGVGALAWEYGNAAAQGVYGAAEAAVESIGTTVSGWFTSAPKQMSREEMLANIHQLEEKLKPMYEAVAQLPIEMEAPPEAGDFAIA